MRVYIELIMLGYLIIINVTTQQYNDNTRSKEGDKPDINPHIKQWFTKILYLVYRVYNAVVSTTNSTL